MATHDRGDQALFGIVQGGTFPHLREQSAGRWPPWACPASPSAA